MPRQMRPIWCLLAACVGWFPVEVGAQSGGMLIISEFRLRGPSGVNDEFVEIYNNSGVAHTVASISGTGYGVAASDGVTRCTILNGIVIPARGHFLCVNHVAYSLSGYPAGNTGGGGFNASYATDIPDNAGIALFNNNTGGASYSLANRFDAVGSTSEVNANYKEGTGYPALVAINVNSSFTRRVPGGCTGSSGGGSCNTVALIQTTPGPTTSHIQDTDNNAIDFIFADPNGNSLGAGQRLGAPGPENLSSPISRDGFGLTASKLDPCERRDEAPNLVRDFTSSANGFFGTLDIRQTFTNNTGVHLTRLRFRIVDITAFPSILGVADLRPLTSGNVVATVDRAPCGTGTSAIAVLGTTLEQPPSQPFGSGFNGSLSVDAITAGSPLAAGASVDVRFLLGIEQNGAGRFCVAAETLPASSSQILCVIRPTLGTSFLNSGAIPIPGTGTTGPASPYPSNISVSGFTGTVTKVTVALKQMNHTFPDDIDVLLVGPTGAKVLLMSDTGGSADLTGQTYTFDSTAAATLQDGALSASGSYRPSNFGSGDVFPAPAPAGPHADPQLLTVFNGLNPNGTWSLYVFDDVGADIGSINGGWELAITSISPPPVTSDFSGNGVAEPAVYRPSTGTWFVDGQAPAQFGLPGDVIVPGDYNGDGTTDRAVYRPSNGLWFVQKQATVQWGLPGDIPVPGDYNGAGTTERAVYRPSNGTWYVQHHDPVQFGLPGDIPVPGDYDGDLTTDFAVYRPSTGTWFVQGQAAVQFGLPGDIPVPADYDGGGATDRAVYRPSTGTWFVQGLPSVQWGLPGDIPAPADFDADAKADFTVYRPSTGTWFIKTSTSNYAASTSVQFGLPGDMPIPNSTVAYVLALRSTLATQSRMSDFDADRLSDLTVYRPASATWFTSRSSTDYATSASVQWGLSGDVPVPHDYDGDGQTDFAVYRPSNGGWYFLRSSTGYTTSGTFQWGLSGDVPMPGDYDGDGVTDPAVYRPSTGTWHILKSITGYTTAAEFQWGLSGDQPLAGDFDGDAITDLTVYRPSTGTWFTRFSGTGYVTSASHQWGLSGDVPIPGEYDGDGKTDHAVYRPSTGGWFILNSSTSQSTTSQHQWGLNADIPVPGDFDGDRKTDVAVWRPSNGTWYLLLSTTNFSVFDQVQWGVSGDIPILKRP